MIDSVYDNYENGYGVGWEEGRQQGYTEGYNDAVYQYETRLAAYWTELQTLNARIDYLEHTINGTK
jgi:flagellar biosynthesis/type III secretory pathway protein FliH